MTSAEIEHREDCPNPDDVGTFVGSRGDHLARCRSCGRLAVLSACPEERPKPQRELVIPPVARVYRTGWPTHKARRRAARRRYYQENR